LVGCGLGRRRSCGAGFAHGWNADVRACWSLSCVVGGGGCVGALLGPEGTRDPSLGLGVLSWCDPGPGVHTSSLCVVGWVLVVLWGSGFVCCLRTAQWTRASLWPSF